MAWVQIDDNFAEHRKITELSDRAFRLHVTALCYCGRNLTDGTLGDRAVRVVSAIVSGTPKHVRELVDADLWIDDHAGGYEVKDFLEYNPSGDEVRELQRKRREAGRRGGVKSGETRREAKREADAEANDEANASAVASKQNAKPRGSTPAPPLKTQVSSEIQTISSETVVQRDQVRLVYDHWRTARSKTDRRYDRISDGRRHKITTRLREFPAAELKRAIDGVALDPWEDRPRHDDITVIFRSREQVERFLDFHDHPPRRNGNVTPRQMLDAAGAAAAREAS